VTKRAKNRAGLIRNVSSEEIQRRVADVRSGRVKIIAGEKVLRQIAEEFDQTVSELRDAFTDISPDELDKIIEEAVANVRRKKKRKRKGRKENRI